MLKRIKILIVLPLVIIPVYFYFFYRIKSVECLSQYSKCSSDILIKLNNLKTGNISATKKEIMKLLDNEAIVKKYSLQLNLDGIYLVHIEQRAVEYCISGNEGSYYSDSEGIVIKITKDTDNKCITNNRSRYVTGDRYNSKDFFAQNILSKLRNVTELGKAYIEDDILTIEYKDGIKLIFPLEGDSLLLAGKTYYIVSEFDIIKEYIMKKGYIGVSEIDFRFNNPIVRII